jgi:hypothetical protein
MFDYNEIRNQVITSIESGDADAFEYDIDAIMDELRDMDVQDLDDIDADEFWDIIARNAR